jgi:hypothetical protein
MEGHVDSSSCGCTALQVLESPRLRKQLQKCAPTLAFLLPASSFPERRQVEMSKHFLISTLAYQLSLTIPAMRDYVADAIGRDPTIFSQTLLAQITKLIIEPLNGIVSNKNNVEILATKCIVIDGLDECVNEEGQAEILGALARCTSACSFPPAIPCGK